MYLFVLSVCTQSLVCTCIYFVRFIVCIYGESKWNVELKGHGTHESMVLISMYFTSDIFTFKQYMMEGRMGIEPGSNWSGSSIYIIEPIVYRLASEFDV